jgi:hypothetical protein
MNKVEFKRLRSQYRSDRLNGEDDVYQDYLVGQMEQFNPVENVVMSSKLFYKFIDFYIFRGV